MGSFAHTFRLMGASWRVLKKDKELLVFPLISGIFCLIVLASFAFPMYSSGYFHSADGSFQFPPLPPGENATPEQWITYVIVIFSFYFCTYFIIVFFNVAVISCAMIRMEGGNPNLIDGFKASFSRIQLILGWAAVAATVGMILRFLEDRSEGAGKFISGLLGFIWTLSSFLVIPLMVAEGAGPFESLKKSFKMLKSTWGGQIAGNFSFGIIFILLGAPAFILIFIGLASGLYVENIIMVSILVLYLLILALVQSALQTIFQAALYRYAKDKTVTKGFDEGLLENAITVKS